MDSDITKLRNQARSLKNKVGGMVEDFTFTYVEMELIDRVFSNIYPQFNKEDKNTANRILKKTSWLR